MIDRTYKVIVSYNRKKPFDASDISTLKDIFHKHPTHVNNVLYFITDLRHIQILEKDRVIESEIHRDQVTQTLDAILDAGKKLSLGLSMDIKIFGETPEAEKSARKYYQTKSLFDGFELMEATDEPENEPEEVAAPAPATATNNSPPEQAFFEGLLRSKSAEEKAAEAEKRAAQEIASFRASVLDHASDAEVEVGSTGVLPHLGLMRVEKNIQ